MPTRILIDYDSLITTGKKIADAGGFTKFDGTLYPGDILIRWGGGQNHLIECPNYGNNIRVLNSYLIPSKINQSILFLKDHVPAPTIFWTRKEWNDAGQPEVVIKKSIGCMGTGMIKTVNPTFRSEKKLVQLYIPKTHEYRAMMVGNIIAFFMEKHPPSNGDFRWNEHRGAEWSTVPPNDSLRRKIKELGHKGLLALGYDFGAIDIIQDNRNNLYILEINSRPEFGEANAGHFVRALGVYLNL